MENLVSNIEALSQAKGIDPQVIIDAVKDAIVVAARKYYRTTEDLVAEFDPTGGQVQVYALKTVTDLVSNAMKEVSLTEARRSDPNAEIGAVIRYVKPTEGLGRISAQLAKQVIFQKIREAERETIFNEYSDRLGAMLSCTVKRVEGSDLIVDIGRTEARLPRREQSRLESFSPGDRVRVVIKGIEKAGRGPAMVVSRADEALVRTLFEQEVPEIYDGTVQIQACAREAGERTKIAVRSRDRDVDAVGACVGMKGMRVQSIIRELRGEKIDIIQYFEDTVEMVTRSLSPAVVSRVAIIDPVEKHLEAIVDDTQLSLAIGKRGQNVRLAARLMGWRIDIKSEEEKRQEVEVAMEAIVSSGTPVSVLLDHGLGEKLVDRLLEAGAGTVEKLADMTPEQLIEIQGVGPKIVEKIQLAVNGFYSQFDEAGQLPEVAEPEVEPLPEPQPEPVAEPSTVLQPPLAAAPGAVMPGLPVEGADDDEVFEPDQDSDTMDLPDDSGEPEPSESEAVAAAETAATTTKALPDEPEPSTEEIGDEVNTAKE